MKRLLSLAIAPLLVLSVFATPAIAAGPKAGTKCSNFGESIVSAGKKFTCLMVGSKQVWNKGVKVSGSTSTSSPFKAPIPISLPVAQNGSITFANIQQHISEIPLEAFKRVQAVISANSISSQIANDIHIGPNTELDIVGGKSRIQEVLLQSQKLWSGFTQVSNFRIFLYSAKDEPWAEDEWVKTGRSAKYFEGEIQGEIKRIAGNCQETLSPGVFKGTPSNCRGADSTAIANTNDAILTIGQGTAEGKNDSFANSGGIIGHEYTHSVQAAQWIGKPSSYCTPQTQTEKCSRSWNSNWGFSPCWLFEGLPNSVGVMGVNSNFDSFQLTRKNLPYGQGPSNVTDYTEASLLKYLVNQSSRTCYGDGDLYRLGYTVGAITVEALTAIGGPQAVMAMYSLGAEGVEFATAFQKVYGISWSEGSKILAKVLAAEYATYGAPPR